MVLHATRKGLGLALGNPKLAGILWLCGLAVAAAAGVPAWIALAAAIGPLPHADALADGMSFGILADLLEMRPGLAQGLALAALGAAGLGLLAGALVTGGVLEVLRTGDPRPLGHRFGRGAFRFFWRFVRAGALALVLGVVLGGLLSAPFVALSRRASASAWEPARFANGAAGAAFAFLGLLIALLALDAARVQIVRDDARRVLPALARGFRAVLGHPVQWMGTWAVNAVLVGAALAVYLLLRGRLPSAAPLALTVLLQQAFVYTRCLFRTALLGSEMALVDRHLPRAVPAPAVVPVEPAAQPPEDRRETVAAFSEESPVAEAPVAEAGAVASAGDENRPR